MKKIYISGKASKKEKDKIKKQFNLSLNYYQSSLSEKEKEFFKKYEVKKTRKDIKIIEGLNKITNDIIREVGGQEYDILPDNIHFLSDEGYFKKKFSKNSEGITNYNKQAIFIREKYIKNKSLLYFVSVMLHEMLHLKGIIEIKVNEVEGRENNWHIFRKGISVISPYNKKNVNFGKYERFKGLHETIITYQQKKSYSDILNLPQLKKQKDWVKSKEYQKLREEKFKRTGCPVDEIISANKKGFGYYSCYWIRKLFDYILKEIKKEFPEYKTKDDVFKEFLKANYKRNQIKKVKELVEKTFGKNSFMVLGNIISIELEEINDYFLYLETFKEFRKYQLKQKRGRK